MEINNFIAGMFYGATTVIVGQPMDTVKTKMQTQGHKSALTTARDIFHQEGVRGLYRGGLPLVVGAAFFRSAQFGIFASVLHMESDAFGERWGSEHRLLGVVDPFVLCAGFAGGACRGLLETPFEFVKTRRQVNKPWRYGEVFNGSSVTIMRTSFLFSTFVIYVDMSKQIVPGGIGPFWEGAICSNLAWLTIWPIDVVKSQIQSGQFKEKTMLQLLSDNFRSGLIFRGLLPGLTRAFIANGCSMVIYKKILTYLSENK